MGSISAANLELIATLASHCLQRTTESVKQGQAVLQQAVQPLPSCFPPGPNGDVALDFARDPLECLASLKSRYGSLVGFKLASRPIVLVSSPNFSREVFVTQSSTFIKAGTAFFPGSSLAGNGLLVSDGDIWKRQRRLSNPAFRRAAIQTYAEAMVNITEKMVDKVWRTGGVRDVYADFNELTMEIVASALFGASEASEEMAQVGPAITQAFQFFTRRATSMFIVPEWVPTFDNIQYNNAVTDLNKVVFRLINERRRQLANSSAPPRKDLLTRLLHVTDEDGSGMDNQSLRDELMTFLVAGQETSAILLTWALLMFALHPHTQELVFQEISEVLNGQLPRQTDVSKLRYLEAFIWETLRLMPPAYVVGRCACHPTELGGYKIPQGTTILVSPYLLHQDPAFWPRVSEFDPSRWMPGGDATEHMENDSFWPFGGGPRNCIGMGFAMMEVTLVLAVISSRFRVSLPVGEPIPSPRAMITLRPESEVKLRLTSRRQQRQRKSEAADEMKVIVCLN
ncbi:uncharacterized protein [Physcomitrium patens]|uniref:Cytochrome P450 n=2 Tax=Physcomitrium patens TaxID=3218 RepID=A0A2K1IGX5_PHYPA|nr:uncharacterized protein LOC112276291 isoform X2 [Physcomitrium patens]PNR28531.1 hypothetical protein PHYPA_029123 [Physcomitrium patens]|eukprot:XP_024363190.1 uncharacterized protein LOC112276291 isoform X2 [Physcomitrella patens]